jgi:hypothetical protein
MSIEAKETSYQLAQPGSVPHLGFEDMSDATSPLIRDRKQGHRCCGGCCDVRRAVIIVNMVNVVMLLMSIEGILVVETSIEAKNQLHDDWFASMKYQDDWFATMKVRDDWFGNMTFQDDWFGNTTFQGDWYQGDWFQSLLYDMEFDEEVSMWSDDRFSHLPFGQLVAAFISALVVQIVICLIGITGAFLYSKCMVGVAAAFYCVQVFIYAALFNPLGVMTMALFAYPHFFLIKEIDQGIMTKQNYPNERMSCCCV